MSGIRQVISLRFFLFLSVTLLVLVVLCLVHPSDGFKLGEIGATTSAAASSSQKSVNIVSNENKLKSNLRPFVFKKVVSSSKNVPSSPDDDDDEDDGDDDDDDDDSGIEEDGDDDDISISIDDEDDDDNYDDYNDDVDENDDDVDIDDEDDEEDDDEDEDEDDDNDANENNNQDDKDDDEDDDNDAADNDGDGDNEDDNVDIQEDEEDDEEDVRPSIKFKSKGSPQKDMKKKIQFDKILEKIHPTGSAVTPNKFKKDDMKKLNDKDDDDDKPVRSSVHIKLKESPQDDVKKKIQFDKILEKIRPQEAKKKPIEKIVTPIKKTKKDEKEKFRENDDDKDKHVKPSVQGKPKDTTSDPKKKIQFDKILENVHPPNVEKKTAAKIVTPTKRTKKDEEKKPKAGGGGDDDEDDDDDEQKKSWWNFYGYFNSASKSVDEQPPPKSEELIEKVKQKVEQKTEDKPKPSAVKDRNVTMEETDIEPDGLLKYLNVIRKLGSKKRDDKIDKVTESSGINLKSYLNRKPFNLLFNLVANDEHENDDDDDGDGDGEKGTKKKGSDNKKEQPSKKPVEVKQKPKGPLTTLDFEEMLLKIPSFVPNYTESDNIECKRQGQIFHRQLRGQKIWAFQMLDAIGKIPSGLLAGNLNQLGNFDLCTDIASKIKVTEDTSIRMRGKYCLAHVEIKTDVAELKLPIHLMQSKSLLRSTLDDPGHFIPRFTIFNWGTCMPAGCSHEDAENFLEDILADYNSTRVKIFVDIDENNCYVKRKTDWEKLIRENWYLAGTIGTFVFVGVVTLLATLNDYWMNWNRAAIIIEIVDDEGGNGIMDDQNGRNVVSESVPIDNSNESLGTINQVLMAFSMKRTGHDLFQPNNETEIGCIHGLRAFGAIGLFAVMKAMQAIRLPYTNRLYLTQILNSPMSIILRSPLLYMDIFLITSGLVAAYSMSRDIEVYGRIRWMRRLLGRLLKVLPLLTIVIFVTAWLWEHIAAGPEWNEIVTANADLCKRNFWRNLLFIQNWDGIEENCSPHTSQLAIDMQLFLIAPIIVWLMYQLPIVGLGLFGMLHAFSAAMRYSATQQNRLSHVIFHGMKLSQIYRTINISYGTLLHRITPYVGGIGLGIMLCQTGKNIKLPKGVVIIGWLSSVASLVWCFFAQIHVTQRDYGYDPEESAQYAAWTSLIFTLGLSWIIFACFTGNGGKLNDILSSKPMVFLSRISYAVNLIQLLILNTFAGMTKETKYFSLSTSFDWLEIAILIGLAALLTLMFDLPLKQIKRMFLLPATEPGQEALIASSICDENHVEGESIIEDIFGNSAEYEPHPKINGFKFSHEEEEIILFSNRKIIDPVNKIANKAKKEVEEIDDIWDAGGRGDNDGNYNLTRTNGTVTINSHRRHPPLPLRDELVDEEDYDEEDSGAEDEDDEDEIEEDHEIQRPPRRW